MNRFPTGNVKALAGIALLVMLAGCQSAYYGAMEQVGYAKRDILADRVGAAAATQQEVQEEVQVAYQAFNALLKQDSSHLEAR